MKTIRIVVLLCISLRALGQGNYSPMLDSLTWLTQTSNFTGTTYHWNYSLGDTTINSFNYTKYSSGLLREDTINRLVYKYDTNNNIDLVLYDFTLNIGDTFLLNTMTNPQTIQTVCVLKDSILTSSGFRDRWYLSFINSQQGIYIYESFGSLTDPIWVYCPPNYDPQWYATCIYHNGLKTYGNLCPNHLTTFQFFLNPSTCGECNGSASVFTTLNQITINWSVPPFTGYNTINLCPQSTGTVTVTQPPSQLVYSNVFMIPSASQPVTQQINALQASCATCCDGSINVSNVVGIPPFSYTWQPSVSSSDTANGLCPGQYIITISDSVGCSNQDTVFISFSTEVTNAHSSNSIKIPTTLQIGQPLEIDSFPIGAELVLFDLRGRAVFRSGDDSGHYLFNHISAGLYLAIIRRGNQSLYQQKIIIIN
jgi:hypothetical protein